MAENDLGKIVNLIMQNPELIEQIKKLGEKDNNDGGSASADESVNDVAEAEEKEEIPTVAQTKQTERSRRRELLCALKPYVSEERGRAIDSMMSIADILDVMRSK